MQPRRIFLAGSSGAVGRTVLDLATERGLRERLVPHLRPRGPTTVAVTPPPDAVICDLADLPALARGMAGCTTVVQLIGTTRKRFAQGDTYDSSDVGTTVALVAAAKQAGVEHLLLLTSVGAGAPRGAYLHAKARAEAAVVGSGIPCTIFRPSAFSGPGYRVPGWLGAPLRWLGLGKYAPIRVHDLASAILEVAVEGAPVGVLEGRSLWAAVARARRPR
jgi:uncharacterized protein YbjT (DUF2867 family)